MEDHELQRWQDVGPSAVDRTVDNPILPEEIHENMAMESFDDGDVVVYTDGACVHNQDARLRR
eukprot:11687251-Karenia_brevis.AAC.1